MFNVNKSFDKFSIGANVGGSFSRTQYDNNGFQGGLRAPSNIFSPTPLTMPMRPTTTVLSTLSTSITSTRYSPTSNWDGAAWFT